MAGALLVQGKTSIRDSLKTLVSHVVVSTDSTAFVKTHTGINPGANASIHAEASTEANVTVTDTDDAFDATMVITGDTEFTGKVINCIGVGKGLALRQSALGTGTDSSPSATSAGTDLISRSVRGAGLGIGVQAGDVFTIGVRLKVEDNSP